MLKLILFLYVFSLSVPVFYHSAFLAGFVSILILGRKRRLSIFRIDSFTFKIISLFFFGYILVIIVIFGHGTFDFSYFKTYTNCMLSLVCGSFISKVYYEVNGKNSVNVLTKDLFIIFFIQSLIIFSVIAIPQLKPFVTYFHRAADVFEGQDVFSGGIRTNALSGGLFFGLSLSFSVMFIIYFYSIIMGINKIDLKSVFMMVITNIGMLISGRFGGVYMICILVFFIYKPLTGAKIGIYFLLFSFFSFVASYFLIDDLMALMEGNIFKYIFEFVDLKDKTITSTASTDMLKHMYDINVNDKTMLIGDGKYTVDGKYYMLTDVGYIRAVLFGGCFLLLYSLYFTVNILKPLYKESYNGVYYTGLFVSLLSLYLLSSFKGEVMMTLVSVNSMVFLFSHNFKLCKDRM